MLAVEQKFEELEERDVLQFLRSYEFIDSGVMANHRVFNKMVNIVLDSAMRNREMVTHVFLC